MEGAMRTSAFEASGEKKIGGKETCKIESLGWITEYSVMLRKRHDIDGVGAESILELQAELYHTQEDVKKIQQYEWKTTWGRMQHRIKFVSFEWITSCLSEGQRLPKEDYELEGLDDWVPTPPPQKKSRNMEKRQVLPPLDPERVAKWIADQKAKYVELKRKVRAFWAPLRVPVPGEHYNPSDHMERYAPYYKH